MQRPTFIDLSAPNSRAPSSADTARTGHPSPRIQHYDGEIPPVLSPLDAFAAESRRLAKELEATRLAGERRMSRLPPQIITKSLSQHQANRPACFRSLSNHSTDSLPPLPRQESFGAGNNPEVKEPSQRPTSSYPRISAVPDDEYDGEHGQGAFYEALQGHATNPSIDYFEIQRTQSPPMLSEHDTRAPGMSRTGSYNSQTRPYSGLVPPTAPFVKNRVYHESSDDDYTSSNGGSTFSAPPRQFSNGSGLSFPTSPALHAQHERSPSNKSDLSVASLSKLRQHFNFSRPLSQGSLHRRTDSPTSIPTPLLERKLSHLSEGTRGLNSFDDSRSVMSDGFITGDSSSYTHKRFVLPRGKLSEKAAQRVSQLFAGLSGPTFGWQEPVFPGTPPLSARTETGCFDKIPSPTFRPSFDPGRPSFDPGRPSFDPGRPSFDPVRPSQDLGKPSIERAPASARSAGFTFGFEDATRKDSNQERPSSSRTAPELDKGAESTIPRPFTSHNASSFDRNKMPTLPPIPGSTADDMSIRSSRPDTGTERSTSTIRPTTARSQTDYQALSAEEHVDKAIELHQNGDLKESTYHLRIAAKQDHPTGMLLYALACRHGWGIRANQQEAAVLLRKAVDRAMMEVAEDEDASNPKPKADIVVKKSHRAQFALAIYELGISHLNGWGVEQDKALALRCFEIAGSWGDADALTEAGFCYAEGVGCKKNLKKAAKFYRQAAEKGVSMVGNSWIYKDKYNDDDDDSNDRRRSRKASATEEKEKKPRNKSKTRSIFGRKRGTTVSDKDKEKALLQPKVSIES